VHRGHNSTDIDPATGALIGLKARNERVDDSEVGYIFTSVHLIRLDEIVELFPFFLTKYYRLVSNSFDTIIHKYLCSGAIAVY
jgi:hypothetical protein